MRAGFTSFHVEGRRVAGTKDSADWDDQIHAPNSGKDQCHYRVIKDAMKGGGNVVCELEDFFMWVGNPEIPKPDELAHEGCSIVDWRIFIMTAWGAGVRNLSISVAVVRLRDCGCGVDT